MTLEHKPLLVASLEKVHGTHSSYPLVAKYISNCETIFTLRTAPQELHQKIANRLISAYATSKWYQTSSILLEWSTWNWIQKNHQGLIHFLWAERDLGYINLLNQQLRQPLCCTFHACSNDLLTIFPFSKRLKKLAAIIIVSETQRQFFLDCGVDACKIHCILHGIDTNFFLPQSFKENSQPFTVLSVGSYRRNFPLLQEVFRELQAFSHIRIKVISAAQNYKYFSDLENVEFISGISDHELLKAYQSASCQIIAVENATANNALLEGLACGLPIVSEKIGGIPEYVNDQCAVLTEPGDSSALVNAIVELSKLPVKRIEMARSARERALELSWPKIAAQLEEVYCSLM